MFTLDKTFENDSFHLGNLPLCRVHLMNNAIFPWLILIPERENMKEIIDLKPEERPVLMQEIVEISTVMQTVLKPDKLNVAALGNITPQLHIHVIARFTFDPCWPDPVWGRGKPSEKYDADSKMMLLKKLLPELKKLTTFKPA